MKIFLWLSITLIGLATGRGNAQNGNSVIVQYRNGKLMTTFSGKTTYLGSAYLGNTIWHQGSLIYRNQREIKGQIAYNIATEQVYWRLNDSTTCEQALPDEFTFEGQRFLGGQYKPLGVNHVSYYEVLYDGKTKLLRKWVKQLKLIDKKSYSIRVPFDEQYDGEYILSSELYIQKEGKHPMFITPDEYSLSRALPAMGPELANFIASHALTEQVLVEALMQYDNRHTSATN